MKALALGLALLLGGAGAAGVTVAAGDTLYSLAARYGTTVEALAARNGLTGPHLRIGQVLALPLGARAVKPAARAAAPDAPRPRTTAKRPGVVRAAGFGDGMEAQSGQAVYYGGRADAETAMTAAHLTLPFGTWVRVTHARTGRSVLVKVNDRGPFGNAARVIDLSTVAARELGILSEGVAPVTVEVVDPAAP